MPAPETNQALLDLVRKAGVVSDQYLDATIQRLNLKASTETPPQLADRLVTEGVLTYYQSVQLLKGRWDCFRIGPYRILERLGFGATSNVYLCEQKATHVLAAVKVRTTLQAEDPVALKRFYREARAANTLEHPNFVQIRDFDWDGSDNYMVMEFVNGSSIQDIVQQFGPMDVHRAAHYVSEAARGLHFAYQAGVVHRDIKPANLMIDRAGKVKILDMGLARFAEEEGGLLTQGEVLGDPEYLSPEQAIDSHKVDSRTDMYSLGATFYFMATGKPPYFEEKSPAVKLLRKNQKPPTPIREVLDTVPEELVAVIDKMMARDPAERYQTPREVIDALAPWTKKTIAPPPDKEMPHLSKAAQTGQGKLGKDIVPVPAPAAEDESMSLLTQVMLVVLLGLVTFVVAWNFFGNPR